MKKQTNKKHLRYLRKLVLMKHRRRNNAFSLIWAAIECAMAAVKANREWHMAIRRPIPRYPKGGHTSAGPAMVGESGPEFVINKEIGILELKPGEKIFPEPPNITMGSINAAIEQIKGANYKPSLIVPLGIKPMKFIPNIAWMMDHDHPFGKEFGHFKLSDEFVPVPGSGFVFDTEDLIFNWPIKSMFLTADDSISIKDLPPLPESMQPPAVMFWGADFALVEDLPNKVESTEALPASNQDTEIQPDQDGKDVQL